MDGAARGSRDTSTLPLERALRFLGGVVAPVTLVTALLFYFGFVRTIALFSEFGVDASVLDLTTQDYLLRGTEAMYAPLGALTLVGLGGLWAHGLLGPVLADPRHRRAVTAGTRSAMVLGAALFLLGVSEIVFRDLDLLPLQELVYPLALGAGTVLLSYGYYAGRPRDPTAAGGEPSWPAITASVLIALLVILSLFWATNAYATAYGIGRAQDFLSGAAARPAAILYAREPLPLELPGVVEHDRGAQEPHRWRYTGLRLLIRSRSRYLLLPRRGDGLAPGPVLILPEDPSTLVLLAPSGT